MQWNSSNKASFWLPSQLSSLWKSFWDIQSSFDHNSWTQVRKKVLRLSQCRQWARPIGTIALPSEVRCLFGILLFWSFRYLFVSLHLAILSTLLELTWQYNAIEMLVNRPRSSKPDTMIRWFLSISNVVLPEPAPRSCHHSRLGTCLFQRKRRLELLQCSSSDTALGDWPLKELELHGMLQNVSFIYGKISLKHTIQTSCDWILTSADFVTLNSAA